MRKKRFYLSISTSIYRQFAFIILGLVLPRLIIEKYGSSVNGLVNSITQFLGYISILELGLQSVVASSLYKPLAQDNETEVSRIVAASKNFFKKIAISILIYSFILILAFPIVISSQYDFLYIATLIIAITVNMFVQYYFGISNVILLNADQRAYISHVVVGTTALINVAVSWWLIKMNVSIQILEFSTSLIYIVRPIIYVMYVKRHYNLQKNIQYNTNSIKNKKSGMAQHIAFAIFKNTDIGVLTLCSTLENVSVYSVYNYIVSAVVGIIECALDNVTALMGNMLSLGEKNKLIDFFGLYAWLVHFISTIVFSVTSCLIVSFVRLYTAGITDANYIAPQFAIFFVIAFAIYIVRIPYNQMIIAAGHYKETQLGSIMEAAINIIISVLMVFRYGLIGVAIGTLCAVVWRTLYLAWYLSKSILFIPINRLFKNVIVDLCVILIYKYVYPMLITDANSYFIWIENAFIITIVFTCIAVMVNVIFYGGYMSRLKGFIKYKR